MREINAIDQVAVIISVGKNNKYNHPSEKVISRFLDMRRTNMNFRLFRTDMQGTITAISDGETIRFSTDHNRDSADVFFEVSNNY